MFNWTFHIDGLEWSGSSEPFHPCFDFLKYKSKGKNVQLYHGTVLVASNDFQNPGYFTPAQILNNHIAVMTGNVQFEVVYSFLSE